MGNMCMKLYISDIRDLFDLPGIELLDESRKNRVYRYHRLEDRARCLTAGPCCAVSLEDDASRMTVSFL